MSASDYRTRLEALAYGEHAPIPLLAEIPAWLAEAAYDEHDRRMFGGGLLCAS